MTRISLTADSFALPLEDPETWQVRIALPAWEEIGQAVEPAPRPGVLLAFETKGVNPPQLTSGKLAHAQWFVDNQEAFLEASLHGLLVAYPDLIESFGYDDEERARWMPELGSVEDLKPLVRPTEVTIHDATQDEPPYIGILFECTWDPEHGTGALLHGLRVVAAGEADHARDGDMVAQDAIVRDSLN